MKRVIIAVILIVLVAALCVGALWEQDRVTRELLASCDHLVTLYKQGDFEACRRDAEALSRDLDSRMMLFPFFLRHERMETVFQDAAALPHLIDDNDPADFLTSLSSMRMQLQILLDNEWPSPENIL